MSTHMIFFVLFSTCYKVQCIGEKCIPFTCQKEIRKTTSVSAQNRFVSAQKDYFYLFDCSETIYEHSYDIFCTISILHVMIGFKVQCIGEKHIPFTCQKEIRKETYVSAQNKFMSAQKDYFYLFDRSETIYERSYDIFVLFST